MMKPPHGMSFERIESEDPNYAVWRVTFPAVVHRCPIDGVAPCCGRTPFELPRMDRCTTDDALVTCDGDR